MTILASATVPNLNTRATRLGSANCRSVASRMYCARPGLILKKQLSSFVIPTFRPSLQALAGVVDSVDIVLFSFPVSGEVECQALLALLGFGRRVTTRLIAACAERGSLRQPRPWTHARTCGC